MLTNPNLQIAFVSSSTPHLTRSYCTAHYQDHCYYCWILCVKNDISGIRQTVFWTFDHSVNFNEVDQTLAVGSNTELHWTQWCHCHSRAAPLCLSPRKMQTMTDTWHMTHTYPLSPIFHLLFHITINAIFGKNSMSSFTFSLGVGGERRNFNFIALRTNLRSNGY